MIKHILEEALLLNFCGQKIIKHDSQLYLSLDSGDITHYRPLAVYLNRKEPLKLNTKLQDHSITEDTRSPLVVSVAGHSWSWFPSLKTFRFI